MPIVTTSRATLNALQPEQVTVARCSVCRGRLAGSLADFPDPAQRVHEECK